MTLTTKFCAPDMDDKTIGNGQVTYKIDSITPGMSFYNFDLFLLSNFIYIN